MTEKLAVLVTGGSGFIMSHAIEHFMVNTDWDIVVLDSLTYAGSPSKLLESEFYDPARARFVYHDIRAPLEAVRHEIGEVDFIIHAAAMSHVENSIHNPLLAFESNGMGTVNVLEFARSMPGLQRFHYVGTDEVYGANDGAGHVEGSPHWPSNPYSCGKSWGEKACYTYSHCYGLPVTVTNTMNNYGERQHPEKFIPMVMKMVLAGETVPIHAHIGQSGSRFWLHARNHADAILYLWDERKRLPVYAQYNVVGEVRMTNLEIAVLISKHMERDLAFELVEFHVTRPGHDLHYGLSGAALADLGWKAPIGFDESFEHTIRWTLENQEWLM